MIVEVIKKNDKVYPEDKSFKYGKYKMNELQMVWHDGYFQILNSDDDYRKYADNIKCLWDIKRVSRRMESLSKYWIIMSALAHHFPESEIDGQVYRLTANDYHVIMKKKFLPDIQIKTLFGIETICSVSFDNMGDESEFREYLGKVVDYIGSLGYDADELINTM